LFTPQEINSYYAQLKLVGKLDSNSGTPDVYILDKEKPQREKEVKIIRRDTVLLVPPN
jgi:hypothetical protein